MARIITPEAILSYPNLFTPRAMGDQEPKYSCALVFPEGTDLTAMKQAALDALTEEWGEKAPAMVKAGQARWPFRDNPDDVALKGYPEGSTFVNVRSNRKPGVVSIFPDPSTGKPTPVTDEAQVYPGVIVRASLDAYTYDTQGNKGVTFGLGNVQIIRDGDRLDGRSHAEDEFEADPDALADLSDLTGEDGGGGGEGDESQPAGVAADGSAEDGDDLSDLLG